MFFVNVMTINDRSSNTWFFKPTAHLLIYYIDSQTLWVSRNSARMKYQMASIGVDVQRKTLNTNKKRRFQEHQSATTSRVLSQKQKQKNNVAPRKTIGIRGAGPYSGFTTRNAKLYWTANMAGADERIAMSDWQETVKTPLMVLALQHEL